MKDIEEKIQKLFEEYINPSLDMHDGSAEIKNIDFIDEEIKVTIKFQGSCVGCPSAENSTLVGIQEFLKEELQISELQILNQGE